jgi:L-ascorbate metabolism protein UlaG (beta-lactamase superfamily)
MTDLTVTRICHSCALIDLGGATILTDPWFSEKPSYHPRRTNRLLPRPTSPSGGGVNQPRPL